MKHIVAAVLVFSCANTFAADTPLLENALSCKLKDSETASLMRELAARQPGLANPAAQFGAPSADVYQLQKPVTALGYTSSEVVVTPGRILLAVPGKPVAKVVGNSS